MELCITFIQSIEQDKIFLIISSSSVSQLLSHIITLHQIDNVFISDSRNDQYEHLPLVYSKIIGIYDKLDLLCLSIKERIDLVGKQIHPSWCCFDQLEYATKDLSKQSNDFLWLHLFHTVLLYLPCDQKVKRQKKVTLIDEFEHEYQPNEAIRWFMKHSLF